MHSDTHSREQFLNLHVGLGSDFVFVWLFWFTLLCVFFCISLDHFIPVLLAFVLLSSFWSVPSQEIGWEERLRNDLCRVGHKTSAQSINMENGR